MDGFDTGLAPRQRLLGQLGSNLATCHLNPARHLLPDMTLNASSGSIVKCLLMLAMAVRHPENGMRVMIQVKNDLPSWAYAKHSGLKAGDAIETGRLSAMTGSFAQHDVMYE
jgi:hypothetical protein